MKKTSSLLRSRSRHRFTLSCESLEPRRFLSATPSGRTILTAPLDHQDPRLVIDLPNSQMTILDPAQIFNLQSKPDSNFTIYLDFNGHITSGTDWNTSYGIDPIISPPFDLDGDRNSFSQQELMRIYTSWQRTAEDFSPFDINVTTRDPGVDALMNSGGADLTWGARAVVSVDNFANCGCGGFAFLNSFTDPVDTPTFVFNLGDGSLGETFSHEVGHMVSLVHDGTNVGGLAYYRGHGGTATTGWGAIMGAPFDQNVTHWDRGEYFDANNQEDDLLNITTLNGFSYRNDDGGNTRGTARTLDVSNSTSLQAFGFIERNTDIDYYVFETGTGNISIDVSTLGVRPNLDAWMGIYNATGTLVAQSNPTNSLSASISNLAVSAGTYYLRVEGVGSHDTYQASTDTLVRPAAPVPWSVSPPAGYSDYGSIGQYAIHGTIVSPSTNTIQIVETDASKVEGASGQQDFTFTVSRSGNVSNSATVTYALIPSLPTAVGDSYPSIATNTDFVAGTPFSGVVSFAANEVSKTLTFPVLGDNLAEQDEYFDIVLSNPTAGWKLADSKATGVILSDEVTVGIPAIGSSVTVNEGPFDGALVRWRQIGAANGAFDEWGLDNITLTNSTFADDFDPGIDTANWTEISNGTARAGFTGGTGNALFMSGGSDRRAVSRLLNAQPGDTLTFNLIFGNSSNGGENADPGEDVVLEYSLNNGSSWTEIAVYDTEDYTSWTTLQAVLPTGIDTNPPATLAFTVAREGGIGIPVTASWSIDAAGLSNPASPDDFVGGVFPSGEVQFDAGESSTTVLIQVQGDLAFEPDEQFRVTLTGASGNGTITLDPALLHATGTIRNDDSGYAINPGAEFRLRQRSYNSGNLDQWAIDNISLSGTTLGDDFDPTIDNSQWADVQGAVVNSNFGGTGNSLFFTGTTASRSITTPRIQVVAGNTLSFDLIYGSDTNGGENPEAGEEVVLEYSLDKGVSWTNIRTYPLPNITWSRKTEPIPAAATVPVSQQAEGNAGSTAYSFLVERGGSTVGNSSIPWSVVGSGPQSASGTDFVGGSLPSGTLTFTNGETRKTVTIQVAGDTQFETNETFDFVLGSGVGQMAVTATIQNDDTAPAGDFNHDGLYNCTDINLLVAQVASGSGNLSFDLTSDGQVNSADVTAWLAQAGAINLPSGNPYRVGDANLDGVVDGSDFGIWNSNKFTSGGGWCGGDFNADGVTDGSDFGLWNSNKFTSSLLRTGDTGTRLLSRELAIETYECRSGAREGDRTIRVQENRTHKGGDWGMRRSLRDRKITADRADSALALMETFEI
jgi:Calx-beta domain